MNTEWIQSVWKLDRLNCSEEDKGEEGEVCLHSLQSQFDQYYWKSRGKETARVPHYKRENADTITREKCKACVILLNKLLTASELLYGVPIKVTQLLSTPQYAL